MATNAIFIAIAVWYLVGLSYLVYLIYRDGWKIGPPLIMRNLPTRTRVLIWLALFLVGPFMLVYLMGDDDSKPLQNSKEIDTDEILNNCWASKSSKEII